MTNSDRDIYSKQVPHSVAPEAGDPEIDIKYKVRWSTVLRDGKREMSPSLKIIDIRDLILSATDLILSKEQRDTIVVSLVHGTSVQNLSCQRGVTYLTDATHFDELLRGAYLYLSTPEKQGNLPSGDAQPPPPRDLKLRFLSIFRGGK